jgi:hypothetical protein
MMNSTELLRRLDPAVRPAFAAPPRSGKAPVESQSFDQLLALARGGQMHSGRQVGVGCELNPPLDAQQLERLAGAADQAEADGSHRALMIMDGRALVLDVASRTIEAELTDQNAPSTSNIDTAVRVGSLNQQGSLKHLQPPGNGLPPAGVIRQLGQRRS